MVFKYFYSHSPLEDALHIPDDPEKGFFMSAGRQSETWHHQSQQLSGRPIRQVPLSPQEAQFCEEVTVYSRRYFLTTINLLQVLHRITQGKTQRVIIVAELPAVTLRKALSIYQETIWEIVLEIFKEGVPYCGRRWRYNNMNMVSAIYLHCRSKLRDDWLVPGDVAQEVEDAHPQEIAMRALIQFYNDRLLRRKLHMMEALELGKFGEIDESSDSVVAAAAAAATVFGKPRSDEPDFFSLELETMSLEAPPQQEHVQQHDLKQ